MAAGRTETRCRPASRSCCVETEKTQTEVEAPASGTLRIAVQAGPDLITVDTVLGEIE